MTDEEAAAIVDEELQRRDREETVREARKILRANYGQRLKEAAAAVTTADQAVEVAKAAVDRQEDLRLASRRGAGPTNESSPLKPCMNCMNPRIVQQLRRMQSQAVSVKLHAN